MAVKEKFQHIIDEEYASTICLLLPLSKHQSVGRRPIPQGMGDDRALIRPRDGLEEYIHFCHGMGCYDDVHGEPFARDRAIRARTL